MEKVSHNREEKFHMYTNNTTAFTDLENNLIKVRDIAERASKKADNAFAEAAMASKAYSSASYMSSKTEYSMDALLEKVAELEKKVQVLEDRDEELQLLYDQVDELAKKNIKLTNRLKKMKKRMDSVAATAWRVDTAKHKKREHAEMRREMAASANKIKKRKSTWCGTEFVVRDENGNESVFNLGGVDTAWLP